MNHFSTHASRVRVRRHWFGIVFVLRVRIMRHVCAKLGASSRLGAGLAPDAYLVAPVNLCVFPVVSLWVSTVLPAVAPLVSRLLSRPWPCWWRRCCPGLFLGGVLPSSCLHHSDKTNFEHPMRARPVQPRPIGRARARAEVPRRIRAPRHVCHPRVGRRAQPGFGPAPAIGAVSRGVGARTWASLYVRSSMAATCSCCVWRCHAARAPEACRLGRPSSLDLFGAPCSAALALVHPSSEGHAMAPSARDGHSRASGFRGLCPPRVRNRRGGKRAGAHRARQGTTRRCRMMRGPNSFHRTPGPGFISPNARGWRALLQIVIPRSMGSEQPTVLMSAFTAGQMRLLGKCTTCWQSNQGREQVRKDDSAREDAGREEFLPPSSFDPCANSTPAWVAGAHIVAAGRQSPRGRRNAAGVDRAPPLFDQHHLGLGPQPDMGLCQQRRLQGIPQPSGIDGDYQMRDAIRRPSSESVWGLSLLAVFWWLLLKGRPRRPQSRKTPHRQTRRGSRTVLTAQGLRMSDPAAGSPTEALLRRIPPLNDKVHQTSVALLRNP